MTSDAPPPRLGTGADGKAISAGSGITPNSTPDSRLCPMACGPRCAYRCPTDLARIADALERLADCVVDYGTGRSFFGVDQ